MTSEPLTDPLTDHLEALQAALSAERARTRQLEDEVAESQRRADRIETAISALNAVPAIPKTRKRFSRNSATELIVGLVKSFDQPATKNELYKALGESEDGFPASWTSPRSSFNNTLGRAVQRGLIVLDGDRYSLPTPDETT